MRTIVLITGEDWAARLRDKIGTEGLNTDFGAGIPSGIAVQQKPVHCDCGDYEAPRDKLQGHATTGKNVIVRTV